METKNALQFGLVVVAIILAAGLVTVSSSKFQVNTQDPRTIQVSGTVENSVEPDQAEIFLGVKVLADTSKESLEQNSQISNNIIRVIKRLGVLSGDIETYSFNIYERYDYSKEKRTSLGFETTHILKITTKNLDDVGVIIDDSVGAEANVIQSVTYTLSKDKEAEVKAQVLDSAAVKAKEKANSLADSLGLSLGKPRSISESNFYYGSINRYLGYTKDTFGAMESTSIQPADVELRATVSITYEIL